jgi:hypothetical protein
VQPPSSIMVVSPRRQPSAHSPLTRGPATLLQQETCQQAQNYRISGIFYSYVAIGPEQAIGVGEVDVIQLRKKLPPAPSSTVRPWISIPGSEKARRRNWIASVVMSNPRPDPASTNPHISSPAPVSVNRAYRRMSDAIKDEGPAQQRSATAPSGHNASGHLKRLKASALPCTVPFLKYFLGRKQPV